MGEFGERERRRGEIGGGSEWREGSLDYFEGVREA